MDNNTAMECLSDLVRYDIEMLPYTDSMKKALKEACNLGISALKTIEDMNRAYKVTDDMKGEAND